MVKKYKRKCQFIRLTLRDGRKISGIIPVIGKCGDEIAVTEIKVFDKVMDTPSFEWTKEAWGK